VAALQSGAIQISLSIVQLSHSVSVKTVLKYICVCIAPSGRDATLTVTFELNLFHCSARKPKAATTREYYSFIKKSRAMVTQHCIGISILNFCLV
jgi:hypothetical protein